MKTKSGTSARISSRSDLKRLPVRIDSTMMACGSPSRQKLGGLLDRRDEVDHHAPCGAARRGSARAPRGARRRRARGCRRAPSSCSTARRRPVDLRRRQAGHLLARRRGNSRASVASPAMSLRSSTQAHGPGGLLDQPPGQRIEARRRRRSVTLVVDLVGGPVAKRQVSRACAGQVFKSTVSAMCACAFASAQSSIALSRLNSSDPSTMTSRRLELVLEADAARLRLARAQREHALQHLLELQHLVRLAHAAEANRVSCWPIMPAWRALLDLVAQGAQAGAVDLAGRGEDVDALEGRGQRRGDLDADLRDQLGPALVVLSVGQGGRGDFRDRMFAGGHGGWFSLARVDRPPSVPAAGVPAAAARLPARCRGQRLSSRCRQP